MNFKNEEQTIAIRKGAKNSMKINNTLITHYSIKTASQIILTLLFLLPHTQAAPLLVEEFDYPASAAYETMSNNDAGWAGEWKGDYELTQRVSSLFQIKSPGLSIKTASGDIYEGKGRLSRENAFRSLKDSGGKFLMIGRLKSPLDFSTVPTYYLGFFIRPHLTPYDRLPEQSRIVFFGNDEKLPRIFIGYFMNQGGARFAGRISSTQKDEQNSSGKEVLSDKTYWIAFKIQQTAKHSTGKFSVFTDDDAFPTDEPSSWDADWTTGGSKELSKSPLTTIGIQDIVYAAGSRNEYSSIRIGTEWEDILPPKKNKD